MAVAPFLPRSGTPYIPRPPLNFTVQAAGAGSVDVMVGNITTNLNDGKVTLRVFDQHGVRVHDVQKDVLKADDDVTFSGVTVATPGPHRLEALTSHGQVGREIVSTTGPAAPTLVSTSALTTAALTGVTITGTGFVSGMKVEMGDVNGTNVAVVSPTQMTADFDLSAKAPGGYELTLHPATGTTELAKLAVTVAAPTALGGGGGGAGGGGVVTAPVF